MSDLDRQIREYTQHLDEAQGALSFEDILERSGEVQVVPGRVTQQPSPRRRWVTAAAAAVVVLIAAIGIRLLPAMDGTPEPADQPTTTSLPEVWSGPVSDRDALVHPITAEDGPTFTWQDPLDAAEGWVDVERVAFHSEGQPHWYIELAAKPPLAADIEPGLIIAYGLVLDTGGDGVADYLIGIDNDAPERGDFHVWVTNLATGETDEQIGPPYGFPIEFSHPDEQQPGDLPSSTMTFTFLGDSKPADLDPGTVRFYAWASATNGDEVVAWDYAPDTGWITIDTPQVTTTMADTEPPPAAQEGEWPAVEPTDLNMSPTSNGVLRWTRVSGDNETLPVGFIEPNPDGSGYLVDDLYDQGVWRSSDGLIWERDAAARIPDESEGVAPGATDGGVGGSLPEFPFPDLGEIFGTNFGWVATGMPESEHVFAISTDGESWEEVLGPPGSHHPSGGGSSAAGAVGDLLFVSIGENTGSRTLWIATFQDLDFRPSDTWPAVEPTDLDRSVTSMGTLSWTRVSGDEETLPGGPIEADGSGGYVAHERDGVLWRSSDGLHWIHDTTSESSAGENFRTGIFETNFGLVEMSMPQSIHLISVSRDGENWETVQGPPGPHEPSGAGFSAAGAAGDLIWVVVHEDTGSRTLWIGKFQE